jgi:gamma-glutamylaminecyclotransferase
MKPPLHHVFVYGTLKRGCCNHHFLADQQFLGAARTAPGFRLFDLGGHPGMVERPADTEGVVGEVWAVDAAALKRLDGLEGLAEGLYRREVVPLLAPFSDQGIEAYLYPHTVAGRREVGAEWRE